MIAAPTKIVAAPLLTSNGFVHIKCERPKKWGVVAIEESTSMGYGVEPIRARISGAMGHLVI